MRRVLWVAFSAGAPSGPCWDWESSPGAIAVLVLGRRTGRDGRPLIETSGYAGVTLWRHDDGASVT